jgi:hypothetical protein
MWFAILFVGGWILQLVGHVFEGRKPRVADKPVPDRRRANIPGGGGVSSRSATSRSYTRRSSRKLS